MPEPVTYTLDEPTYRRLLWKHYGDYPLMRSRWVTGSLNILIGFALLRTTPMLVLGTCAILIGIYLLCSRHYYIYKVIRGWKRLPDSNRQTRLSIRDNRVCMDSEIIEATLAGESIAKVRDFGIGFLIYLSRHHFIAVPRNAFMDDQQYKEWINAICTLAGPESAKKGWR